MSAETNSFTYTVTVKGDAQYLASDELAPHLVSVGELAIVSKTFNDYAQCISVAGHLVSELARAVSHHDGKSYVLVTRKNPLYDATEIKVTNETWDNLTLVKLYAAETSALKKHSTLNYQISAEVKIVKAWASLNRLSAAAQ